MSGKKRRGAARKKTSQATCLAKTDTSYDACLVWPPWRKFVEASLQKLAAAICAQP